MEDLQEKESWRKSLIKRRTDRKNILIKGKTKKNTDIVRMKQTVHEMRKCPASYLLRQI